MSRSARCGVGGLCYHALNRGNRRAQVFFKDGDYQTFLKTLGNAYQEVAVPVLAYCLLPNHFHVALWPTADGQLGRFLHWWLNAHVRRYHAHYHSSGHLWQARTKTFPIGQDEHLLTILRYIEYNPVRAGLVERAEQWPWSSARWWRLGERPPLYLHAGPVDRGRNWLDFVNQPLTLAELAAVRTSANRGRPYGQAGWVQETAARLGLGKFGGRGKRRRTRHLARSICMDNFRP
jgi:putative transposase